MGRRNDILRTFCFELQIFPYMKTRRILRSNYFKKRFIYSFHEKKPSVFYVETKYFYYAFLVENSLELTQKSAFSFNKYSFGCCVTLSFHFD